MGRAYDEDGRGAYDKSSAYERRCYWSHCNVYMTHSTQKSTANVLGRAGQPSTLEEEEGFYILSSHTRLIRMMTNQTFRKQSYLLHIRKGKHSKLHD